MVHTRVCFNLPFGVDFWDFLAITARTNLLASFPKIEFEGVEGSETYKERLEAAGNPIDEDIVRNITIKGYNPHSYEVADSVSNLEGRGSIELGCRTYSHAELGKMLEV